jgi:seryl-tRNA synthetase
MLDIKKIRNNPDKVLKSLKRKDNNISIDKILKIDAELKVLTTELNDLQANQNSKSKEIGLLKSKGESADGTFSDLKVLSEKIKNLEKQQRILSSSLKKELLEVPNIPHLSSPHGADSKDNVIVHENNSNRKFNFDLKNHIDIGTELGILDFEVAAKMS